MTPKVVAINTRVEIHVAGQVLRLQPLTDEDVTELEVWMAGWADKSIHSCNTQDGLTTETRQWLAEVYEKAGGSTLNSEAAGVALCSMEGITKLVWMGMRKEIPGLTYETVSGFVLRYLNREIVLPAIREGLRKIREEMEKKKEDDKRQKDDQ
jgi:hypothetical protein